MKYSFFPQPIHVATVTTHSAYPHAFPSAMNPPIRQSPINPRAEYAHGLRFLGLRVHAYFQLRIPSAVRLIVLPDVLLDFGAHGFTFSLAYLLECVVYCFFEVNVCSDFWVCLSHFSVILLSPQSITHVNNTHTTTR